METGDKLLSNTRPAMVNTLRIFSKLYNLKDLNISHGIYYLIHNSYEILETAKYFELISFSGQITKSNDARNNFLLNKIKPLSKTNFLSLEDRQEINKLTSKLMDRIISDAPIESSFNFHGFPLLDIDRSAFVVELYHIIESFYAYNSILEHLKPTKVEVLDNLPFYEEELLRSLCSQKKITFDFQYTTKIIYAKFKEFSNALQKVIDRQIHKVKNYSQLRRIRDYPLSSVSSRGKKILIFAFEEVQANSVIPVLKMIKKLDAKIKIISLAYDRGAANYYLVARQYNNAGFPIFIGSPIGFTLRTVSVDPQLFFKNIVIDDIIALILNEFPNLQPIKGIIAKWLIQKLRYRIPYLLKVIRVFFKDIKTLNPGLLIISNDYNLYSKMLTFIAKKLNIFSILIPHAQISSHYIISKINADLMISSGEHETELLKSSGFAPANIFICGTPKYDITFNDYLNSPEKIRKRKVEICKKLAIDPAKKIVLVATSDGFENNIRNQFLESILRVLKTYNDISVIIKLHPRDTSQYATSLLRKYNVHYKLLQSFPIFDLLLIADVLFTHISGVAFEAMLFGKPSIEINYTNEKDRFNYLSFNAVIPVTNPTAIKPAFEKILYNEIEIQKLQEGQKKLIQFNLFKFDGKSSERAAQIILTKLKS